MNPFEMTVLIVAIVMIAKIFSAKYKAQNRSVDHVDGPVIDPDAARMRDEIRALKERVAVLERIATDGQGSAALERQIDALRSRD